MEKPETEHNFVEVLVVRKPKYFDKDLCDFRGMCVDWNVLRFRHDDDDIENSESAKILLHDALKYLENVDEVLLKADLSGKNVIDAGNSQSGNLTNHLLWGTYDFDKTVHNTTWNIRTCIGHLLGLRGIHAEDLDHMRLLYKNGWCAILLDNSRNTFVWRKSKDDIVVWKVD